MLTFTVTTLRIKAYNAIKPNLNVVSCSQLRLFWVHWAWLQAPPIAPLAAGLCLVQPIEPPPGLGFSDNSGFAISKIANFVMFYV